MYPSRISVSKLAFGGSFIRTWKLGMKVMKQKSSLNQKAKLHQNADIIKNFNNYFLMKLVCKLKIMK